MRIKRNRFEKAFYKIFLKDLCEVLCWQAKDTWNRIEFVRKSKWLKIYETTITQNILYSFEKAKEYNNSFPISLYEAVNERSNGNDIELIIKTNTGKYLQVPVQAKILNAKLKYGAIKHKYSSNEYQIDGLLDYAKMIQGIPLYLLYNGILSSNDKIVGEQCEIRFNAKQFGCSLVSAHYIKKTFYPDVVPPNRREWKIPTFCDLHPHIALPWFILGCCSLDKKNLKEITSLLLNIERTNVVLGYDVKEKTWEELDFVKDWLKFEEPRETSEAKNQSTNESTLQSFSPRYRIVVGSIDNQSNG